MHKSTALLAALAVAVFAQSAQAWPNRPIKMVVPFPPGGGTDVVARIVSDKLSAELGQPIVIDNKPGADTQIGLVSVARSPADGYTIGIVTPSLVINKTLYAATVQYDPIKDFTPIGLVAATPFYLAVGTNTHYKSTIQAVKLQPGR